MDDLFCTPDSGVPPIAVHAALLFGTASAAYLLRTDRLLVALLLTWEANLICFAIVKSLPVWYALVAFDLWLASVYLNAKNSAHNDVMVERRDHHRSTALDADDGHGDDWSSADASVSDSGASNSSDAY